MLEGRGDTYGCIVDTREAAITTMYSVSAGEFLIASEGEAEFAEISLDLWSKVRKLAVKDSRRKLGCLL
jgi:hypothetical protein